MSIKKVYLKGKEAEENLEVVVTPEKVVMGQDEEVKDIKDDEEIEEDKDLCPNVEGEHLEDSPVEKEETEEEEETEASVVVIEPEVVVEPEVVSNSKVAESTVRIRMRVNHNCAIGGEHYYLKEAQCYNVSPNVKDILNRAGLLAPL